MGTGDEVGNPAAGNRTDRPEPWVGTAPVQHQPPADESSEQERLANLAERIRKEALRAFRRDS